MRLQSPREAYRLQIIWRHGDGSAPNAVKLLLAFPFAINVELSIRSNGLVTRSILKPSDAI